MAEDRQLSRLPGLALVLRDRARRLPAFHQCQQAGETGLKIFASEPATPFQAAKSLADHPGLAQRLEVVSSRRAEQSIPSGR